MHSRPFFSDEGKSFAPQHNYPGVAIFMQNILIFGSSMLYKFGRQEEGMWWWEK